MEAGFHLGCDRSYVKKLASGERRPGVNIVLAVERLSTDWSEGPILASEWLEARPGSSASRAKPLRARKRLTAARQ